MKETLLDLYGHQEWADAALWRACESQPGALADTALWERMHHIHLVQQAFLGIVRGLGPGGFKFTQPSDYAKPEDLKAEARQYHAEARGFLQSSATHDFEKKVTIPWFKEPPLELMVGQALLQAAMHSHYHRGQQATRLRELGGAPPLTDYIVWLWNGKALPQWT